MPEQTEATLAEEIKGDPALADRPRGTLTRAQEEEIERRRQQNVLAATIAGLSWGRNMTPAIRRAIADYCARYDVDPVTEMDNLGGNVYVNADWFLRKLGQLRVIGIVKDFTLEHIHADPRLRKLFEDESLPQAMRDEARRRWFDSMMKRIEHNAPELAEAICICTIYLHNGSPVKGCKWAGGGTSIRQPKHGGGSQPNPVTESNPTLSVESQAIRRALRQLLSHISGKEIAAIAIPSTVDNMDTELETLSDTAAATTPAPASDLTKENTKAIGPGGYGEGADDLERRLADSRKRNGGAEVSAAPAPSPLSIAFAALRDAPDPYGEPNEIILPERAPPAAATPAPDALTVTPAPAPLTCEHGRQRTICGECFPTDTDVVALNPAPGPPSTDLFGSETRVEPTALDEIVCELCEQPIRKGHPEDHAGWCDGYADAQ